MRQTYLWLSALFVLLLILSACSPNIATNTYDADNIGVSSRVVPGKIISMRPVTINNTSGVGGAAGAVSGAVVGSSLAGNNSAAAGVIGIVGGAVAGGVIGHAIDQAGHQTQGNEYIIKIKSGDMVSIVQPNDLTLPVGERVLILYGARTRIIPDTTLKSKGRRHVS